MSRTLLRHGHVHAPGVPGAGAGAMLVDGPTVAWVGADAAADDGWADHVVDLDGALVTPAFVDAHVHATATGLTLTGLDLSRCASLADALDATARHARRTTGVLLGHGWDESRWPERRPPRATELDQVAPGRAVYLSRVDAHSAVVSTALLDTVAGRAAAEPVDPDGYLSRHAHHVARRAALDAVPASQRRHAQQATLRRAAEAGVGCVHECAGPDISGVDDVADLVQVAAGRPGPEVLVYWGELGGVERARDLGAAGAAGDLFADGALGSRTAWLRATYADSGHGPGSSGAAYLTAAQVRDHVLACDRAGVQAGFHAIGDAALDTVLGGFEEAAALVGRARLRAGRHRVEHAEMLDADMVGRFAALGLVASVQPAFDAAWGGSDGMYAERLGAERAATLNPYAAMAAAGIPLAFGSDAPVTPLDPWAAVAAAVWHRTPAHRLDPATAFGAHTRGGWYAAGARGGGLAGTLAAGAPATYAVWACPGEVSGSPPLPDLAPGAQPPTCLLTVVGGHTVHAGDSGLEAACPETFEGTTA